MKLGLNLWIWDAPFRTDRHLALIPQVRALGGEVVEFALEDDSVVDEQLLQRTLADEGLACSVVGLFGPDRDLSLETDGARQNGLAYARRCIDVCAGVGRRCLRRGRRLRRQGAARARRAPRPHRTRGGKLRELGDYAAQAGVGVAVEILNRYENNLLTTAAHGRELIDLTDHPAVGIHLDSFHMGIEETDLGGAIRWPRKARPLPWEREPPRHARNGYRAVGAGGRRAAGDRLRRLRDHRVVQPSELDWPAGPLLGSTDRIAGSPGTGRVGLPEKGSAV